MVLLFNVAPYLFVLFMGLVIWYAVPSKVGKWVMGVFTALVFFFYMGMVQPSYGPKGVVTRSELPAFEDRKIEAVDRLMKPKGGEFYDKLRSDTYKQIELKAAQAREDGKNE